MRHPVIVFLFQSALPMLKSVAVGFEGSGQSKLSPLFDVTLQITRINAVLDNILKLIKTPSREQYKKLASATRNHERKLENLPTRWQ